MAIFDPGVRSVVGELGQEVAFSSAKARERLGWSPRAIEDTIVDCARSLLSDTATAETAAA
jgi:dihydroflavonol-4-reductase